MIVMLVMRCFQDEGPRRSVPYSARGYVDPPKTLLSSGPRLRVAMNISLLTPQSPVLQLDLLIQLVSASLSIELRSRRQIVPAVRARRSPSREVSTPGPTGSC